jgi:hypothetical protein
MRLWLALLITGTVSAETACEKLARWPAAKKTALGPIVALGASVTAGYGGVTGPAERLADLLDLDYDQYAASGATSAVSLAQWRAEGGACGTLVGVDTFFWDTVRGCGTGAVAAVVAQATKVSCDRIILATVPRLLPVQRGGCLGAVNQDVESHKDIEVLPAAAERRAEHFRDDRIHLTEAGAQAATERLCQVILDT